MRKPSRFIHRRTATALLALVSATTIGACSSSGDTESATTTTRVPKANAIVVVGTAKFTNYNLATAAGGKGGKRIGVVWNDYDDKQSYENPFIAVSDDKGVTFAEPVLLDPKDHFLAYPDLAIDTTGTMYVAVTRYLEGDSDGWPALYTSTDGGKTFAKKADLTDAPSTYFGYSGAQVAVSDDGKTIVLAWNHETTGKNGDTNAVYGSVSTDGGATFSAPERVAPATNRFDASRVKPFTIGNRAAIAAPFGVPIPNPPKPTPANPNPATSEPSIGIVLADEAGTFGDPIVPELPDTLEVFQGPGADSDGTATRMAWWGTNDGNWTTWLADFDGKSFAAPVAAFTTSAFADPATNQSSALETEIDGAGATWLLVSTMNGETPELHLVLAAGGGKPTEIPEAKTPRLTSGNEYDLAALESGGVVMAWLEGADVKVRTVTR